MVHVETLSYIYNVPLLFYHCFSFVMINKAKRTYVVSRIVCHIENTDHTQVSHQHHGFLFLLGAQPWVWLISNYTTGHYAKFLFATLE